eukprot:scaffold49525_cov24-Tisochrysis_lutea.AAC.1
MQPSNSCKAFKEPTLSLKIMFVHFRDPVQACVDMSNPPCAPHRSSNIQSFYIQALNACPHVMLALVRICIIPFDCPLTSQLTFAIDAKIETRKKLAQYVARDTADAL